METIDIIKKENEELKQKICLLENENIELKNHLKKYTAPSRNKKYYETHKEELLKKMKDNPTSPKKRKEYNKIYYQRRKEQKLKEQQDIII